jgi:conjugal transfer ATP-binding protein TraC
MVVFNIRDLEDELRPVAMYIVLNYIWNKTKSDKKRRLLVVDEAWQLMKYEDSANFIFSLAKRARKYNLGLTTITQDVEDFMSSRMGRAIVRLSQFPVGQGLFFAGQNHVHIQVIASQTESDLISTTPKPVPAQSAADLQASPTVQQTNTGS